MTDSQASLVALRLRRSVSTWLGSGAVATLGWWALLGWDTEKIRGSDGYQHGPYSSWQIILLVIVIAALATWLGHRGSLVGGPAVAAIAITISFAYAATHDPEDDGLWPIGAMMLLLGCFAGMVTISRLSKLVIGGRN